MFLVTLTYKQPLEIVEKYTAEHRAFLDTGYTSNYLIVSGPKNPRNGGIIIANVQDKNILEQFLKQDPFYIHDIAEYEITEFLPIKYHPSFQPFINAT